MQSIKKSKKKTSVESIAITVEHPDSGNKKVADPQKSNIVKEINGPKGLEPTRYGDWESKGRCHDF